MGLTSSTPSYIPSRDIPDLTGKVALVTGGSSGIGYYTVAELARHGAKVYMGARDESRATGAIAQLKAEGALVEGKGEVIWLKLDLSTPESTKAAADDFLKREERLDILVNNAAMTPRPEGFQQVDTKVRINNFMCTNHLGPFVLTTTLLPLIEKTAAQPGSDVRIITLSSARNYDAYPVSWNSPGEWMFKVGSFQHSMRVYGNSKLANVLFSKQLQARFDEGHVDAISISVDPGNVSTPGSLYSTNLWRVGRLLMPLLMVAFFITPPEGAYTSLFAATSPTVKREKARYAGAYLMPYGVIRTPNKVALDPIAAKDLWETSERLAAEAL